jgi:hypothetical protein
MKNPFAPTHTPAPLAPSRFAGMRPIAHDVDERQRREDRDYGQTFFTRYFTLMRTARR